MRLLGLDALRRQWRLVFGRVPPAGLTKLLGRMIAARLQERAFGGLDRAAHARVAILTGININWSKRTGRLQLATISRETSNSRARTRASS